MFLPKDAVLTTIPNERIALIGPPGAGKTTSLLTFPNLIIFDRDKKCPPNVQTIPAWNPDWADSLVKRTIKDVPNFRDAIKKWLRENHDKFTAEQTFAIDSATFVIEACDLQTHVEDDFMPPNPKTGQKDGYWFWGQKLRYMKELHDFIKSMKCRVVVTFHETIDRDETGKATGKIRPAVDGSYKDYILGNYTDVWRQRANVPLLDQAGKAVRDAKGKVQTDGFFWQLMGDSVVDLNLNPTLGRLCRQYKIERVPITLDGDTVNGGYKAIQEIYSRSTVVKQ